MMAAVARGPLESGGKWKLRIFAASAALIFAGAMYFLEQLPSAATLNGADRHLEATSGEALAFYNLRAAPLLEYAGMPGAGLGVSISAGRPVVLTRNSLLGLGLQVPNVKGGAIEWQGKPAATGRISVRIRNGRQSPEAGVIVSSGSEGSPELKLRAVQTSLTVEIGPAQGAAEEGAAVQLRFADADLSDPALASRPLLFDVQPGETVRLRFDNANALTSSTFRLGDPLDRGDAAGTLPVGRAEVGHPAPDQAFPQLQSVKNGVCSARAGDVLFQRAYPTPASCKLGSEPARDKLVATAIEIEPGGAALTLAGSGFIIANDRVKPAASWSAIILNPLVAGLIVLLVLATAWPLWRLWTGRDM